MYDLGYLDGYNLLSYNAVIPGPFSHGILSLLTESVQFHSPAMKLNKVIIIMHCNHMAFFLVPKDALHKKLQK